MKVNEGKILEWLSEMPVAEIKEFLEAKSLKCHLTLDGLDEEAAKEEEDES